MRRSSWYHGVVLNKRCCICTAAYTNKGNKRTRDQQCDLSSESGVEELSERCRPTSVGVAARLIIVRKSILRLFRVD